jgi:acid stress-induced BolA-like protein IbaG/YrbA
MQSSRVKKTFIDLAASEQISITGQNKRGAVQSVSKDFVNRNFI